MTYPLYCPEFEGRLESMTQERRMENCLDQIKSMANRKEWHLFLKSTIIRCQVSKENMLVYRSSEMLVAICDKRTVYSLKFYLNAYQCWREVYMNVWSWVVRNALWWVPSSGIKVSSKIRSLFIFLSSAKSGDTVKSSYKYFKLLLVILEIISPPAPIRCISAYPHKIKFY